METTRKTLKAATWMGFFLGEEAVRSHPTGLRYIPRWVLKRFLNRAGSWYSQVGYCRIRYLQTEHRYVTTLNRQYIHHPRTDFFPRQVAQKQKLIRSFFTTADSPSLCFAVNTHPKLPLSISLSIRSLHKKTREIIEQWTSLRTLK